jgi:precorrin-6A/cobalt-precorrin-6A reductase
MLREHRIDLLVSKNAGGMDTYAKLEAARELGLPVILVDRPALPARECCETVQEAMDWLGRVG